eukprot:TRINITY_DN3205_c0_g1_i1.p1 TRINITY_DN3205_c0_g1~~TRINITY_DN3205_c0_g1_i1.p1  ORF type:complete len:475 (+),score=53.95 TRINITY_DN3205_c0_g1_i1:416-1840(+)
MGAYWSHSKNSCRDHESVAQGECSKRQKLSYFDLDERSSIISALPDEISVRILARIPRVYYPTLKVVCKTWNHILKGTEIYKLRKDLCVSEEWLYILIKDAEERLLWYAFDPLSRKWQSLPQMPSISVDDELNQSTSGWSLWTAVGVSGLRLTDIVKSWLGRKDSLDRTPFCGCAVGSIDGFLYVLGGFFRACALKNVWRYDPRVNVWTEVAPMNNARAYCKTAFLNGKLYVVGGVNRSRNGLTPLQSAEVYDPVTNTWREIPSMPFARTQVLPIFMLADMLKPIATGMTAFRGKLCVPQSLYSWPFFVDVGGEIYDPETDSWMEMPKGMGDGWPARQAGTKLSVVVNDDLYALDPSSTLDSGKIKRYDPQEDAWKVILSKVPFRDFTDSESPYLLSGLSGKLHVITKDGDNISILQAEMLENLTTLRRATSSSSSDSSAMSTTLSDPEPECWQTVSVKNFGYADLVNCQVIQI